MTKPIGKNWRSTIVKLLTVSSVILIIILIISIFCSINFFNTAKWIGAIVVFIGIIGLGRAEPIQDIRTGTPSLNTEMANSLEEKRKPINGYFKENRVLSFDNSRTVVLFVGIIVLIVTFAIELAIK